MEWLGQGIGCFPTRYAGYRPLTLYDRNGGLGTNPGDGRVLSAVIAPGVVASPALIGPRVLQCEACDAQHTDPIGAVGHVDGYPAFAGSVP